MLGSTSTTNKFTLFYLLTTVILTSCGGGSGGGGLPSTDTTAPTVLSKTPSPALPGETNILPVTTLISVTFDEPMDKNSVENGIVVTPNNGGKIVYDEASNTATYTLANQNLQGDTEYTISLKNSIKDKSNNFLAETISWSFITIDNVSPSIVSFLPIKNSQAVGLLSNVVLTFSEPVTKASFDQNFLLEIDDLTGNGRTVIAGVSEISGNQVIFNPTQPLAATTTHYVTISQGIVDAKNNAMPAIPSYTFKTGTDNTRPSFTLLKPLNGAQAVTSKTTIDVEFSKKIATASLTPANFRVQAQNELDSTVLAAPVNGTFTQTATANNTYIVSFKPNKKLNLLNQYSITLTNDIVDDFSNPLIVPNNTNNTFRVKDGTWAVGAFPIQELTSKVISEFNIQTVFDSQGNRLVVWLERDINAVSNQYYTTIRSRQFLNDGTGWQATVTVATVKVSTSLPNTVLLAMDQAGDAILTWVQTDPAIAANFQLKAHRFINGNWSTQAPEILATGFSNNLPFHALDMLPDGSAISVWDLDIGSGNDTQIFSKRFVPNNGIKGGVWITAENVLTNNPDLKTATSTYISHVGSVSLDKLGVAHVLYNSHTLQANVSKNTLWSSKSPFSLNAPVRVDATPDNDNIVTIYSSHDDSGIIDVTWGLITNTNLNEIWGNHYTPSNGWSTATKLNTIDTTSFTPDHKSLTLKNGNNITVINQNQVPYALNFQPQSGWSAPVPIGTNLARDYNSIHADPNSIILSSWVNDTGIMFNRYIPSTQSWLGEKTVFTASSPSHVPSGNIMLSSLPDGTSFAVWAEFGPKNPDLTKPTFIYSVALEER
ncbi:hypothetical protein MNBD_GAMMA22-2571 [hydrothermal vent metagenome]|uniref:SbsA Ig-like domain-containing protein n=1 Tax=hydrothermal vent metagenome TaxID=652676 RepID=A0A3B1ASG8_9ZZZZ